MSAATAAATFDRHDRRLLVEAHASVQSCTAELHAYCRALAEPTDGTVADLVEMLTSQAMEDFRMLSRATTAFVEFVDTMRSYTELFGDATVRAEQARRAHASVSVVRSFVEQLFVKVAQRKIAEAAALATTRVGEARDALSRLDALTFEVARSFGFAEGSTLSDDDDSSSEDSDYLPALDDDDLGGLIEDDDDDASHDLLPAYTQPAVTYDTLATSDDDDDDATTAPATKRSRTTDPE